jgi:hypothetical protein
VCEGVNISPRGQKITPGYKVYPWEQTYVVKNWPQKLLLSIFFGIVCFVVIVSADCQIFLWKSKPNGKNIPNYQKIFQMVIKIPKGRKIDQMSKNTPTYSTASPSKMYPNYDFWSENELSGNPACQPVANI